MLSVLDVVGAGLCAGCGGCVVFCPHGVLRLVVDGVSGVFVPVPVVDGVCVGCGFCLKVCPGHEVDFDVLNGEVFGVVPDDPYLGNFSDCFVGFSCDEDLRFGASSGGLVSQFLVFALNEGLIDGALVTRMSDDNPLMAEPFIAYTVDDILDAKGSKYCPVPVNLALKEILDAPDDFKFAVVGLPCHIHGIRKAEQVNKKLKNKIKIHMGIVCNHTPTFNATEYLLEKNSINKKDIKRIDYRGSGWPGKLKITSNNGQEFFTEYFSFEYWGSVFNTFFFPRRCSVCTDKSCKLADISFADAWCPEIIENDNSGTSLLIDRTDVLDQFLNIRSFEHNFKLKKVSKEVALQSQQFKLVKQKVNARLRILKFFRIATPSYIGEKLEFKFKDILFALLFYSRNSLSSRRFWGFINFYCYSYSLASRIKRKLKN